MTTAVYVVGKDVVSEIAVGTPILVISQIEGRDAVVLVFPEFRVGVGVGRILFDTYATDQSDQQKR